MPGSQAPNTVLDKSIHLNSQPLSVEWDQPDTFCLLVGVFVSPSFAYVYFGSMYVCTCVFMEVCAHADTGQRTNPSVIPPQAHLVCFYCLFLYRLCYWDLGLTNQGRLAGQRAPDSACLQLHYAETTRVYHHTRLFTWIQRVEHGLHTYTGRTLLTETSHFYLHFNLEKLYNCHVNTVCNKDMLVNISEGGTGADLGWSSLCKTLPIKRLRDYYCFRSCDFI